MNQQLTSKIETDSYIESRLIALGRCRVGEKRSSKKQKNPQKTHGPGDCRREGVEVEEGIGGDKW